jgi:hypothetical protein
MISYKSRSSGCDFSDPHLHNSEEELSLGLYTKRCFGENNKKRKEQLIRELTKE